SVYAHVIPPPTSPVLPYTTLFRSHKVDRIRQLLRACGCQYSEYRSERMWRGRPSVCVNWYLHLEDSQKILALAPEKQMTFGLARSEEHTSELQSPDHLVCRLLLEK